MEPLVRYLAEVQPGGPLRTVYAVPTLEAVQRRRI